MKTSLALLAGLLLLPACSVIPPAPITAPDDSITPAPVGVPFMLATASLGSVEPLAAASVKDSRSLELDEFEGEYRQERASDRDESWSGTRRRTIETEFGLNIVGYPDTDFDFGDVGDSWNSSNRYELHAMGYMPLNGHVEPLAGAYVFFEQREWHSGPAEIDYDAYGFGAELGALIYPVKRADERLINVALLPFARFGLGFNDGDFSNVPRDGGFVSGGIHGLRLEASVGAEVRMIVARKIVVGVGAGWDWWEVYDVSGVVRNGAGVIIIRDSDLGMRGTDVFARLTVGMAF